MKWFYNLKISAKLLIGFIIVSLIAGAVGVVGIVNLKNLDHMDTLLYEENVIGISDITDAQQHFLHSRIDLSNFLIFAGKDLTQYYKNMDSNLANLEKSLQDYDSSIISSDDRKNFDTLNSMYKILKVDFSNIVNASKSGKSALEIATLALSAKTNADQFGAQIDKMAQWNLDGAKARSDANTATANATTMLMIIIVVSSIIISIALGIFISRIISKPVVMLAQASNKLAAGDIDVSIAVNSRDETGQLATAFKQMAEGIKEQVYLIERIAEGDMTVNIQIRSEKDVMNKKLSELIETNNQIFGDIRSAADQVEAAAGQVSAGSQVMAQGATEQASIVEEVNASVEEITTQAKQNAANSRKASELAVSAKVNATAGTGKMKEMMKAMEEINESSDNISKIIKVIDEIAFQTNILALNAAVEAARAGAHGKGFAVVAEEVRNLAGRSAQAAKETTEMIEGSIKKTGKGTDIAKGTKEALDEIVGIIGNVADTIDAISNASTEQATAVSQVSQAISQIAGTTQTNSATAQESAAASEELSSQAMMLKDSVARFKLKKEAMFSQMEKSNRKQIVSKLPEAVEVRKSFALTNGAFGKY